MIERIVLLRLAPAYATPEGCEAVAARSREVLPQVAGVQDVTVGVALEADAEWHVSLVVRLGSADDLAPYGSDPAHRAYVDHFLRPRLEAIRAWNVAC